MSKLASFIFGTMVGAVLFSMMLAIVAVGAQAEEYASVD